jgi:predicted nucleic acid-binding protein
LAVKTALIDTGPFVAYLNRRDPVHETVAASLEDFPGQLVTTAAVVGETMHFLAELINGPIAFAKLLADSNVRIAETGPPLHVLAAAQLMAKYSDLPMDYADATLVLLASEVGVTDIFTLDHRGFSVFRTSKSKPFRLLLS